MPWDWIILISIILVLCYTLLVIKEEKNSFLDNAIEKDFHQFCFLIPSWWGVVEESENVLRYQRLDTRYEWEAKYEFIPQFNKDETIEDQFKNFIHDLEMLFDVGSGVIMNPTDFNNNEYVQSGRLNIVRIEGMATQSGMHRRYLDAFLIRDMENGSALFATSLSSILNGLVEGPYFEEGMLNFSLTST